MILNTICPFLEKRFHCLTGMQSRVVNENGLIIHICVSMTRKLTLLLDTRQHIEAFWQLSIWKLHRYRYIVFVYSPTFLIGIGEESGK